MIPTTTWVFVLPVRLYARAKLLFASIWECAKVPMTYRLSLSKDWLEQSVLAGCRRKTASGRFSQLFFVVLMMGCLFSSASNAACNPLTLTTNGPDMVYLPGGNFTMGSDADELNRDDDEGPQTEVWIAPFAMMGCEVTRGEFETFVTATGYISTSGTKGCYTESAKGEGDFNQQAGKTWRDGLIGQTSTHPVVCVSWQDAQAYAQWVSLLTGHVYRLPSEAEFEYALRAGSTQTFPWPTRSKQCMHANGADQSTLSRYQGFTSADCDDGFEITAPVASLLANPLGLHDLSGNVWEWVSDCWNANHKGGTANGLARSDGNCDLLVLRGGSWSSGPVNLRSAYRSRDNADDSNGSVGFRLARAL